MGSIHYTFDVRDFYEPNEGASEQRAAILWKLRYDAGLWDKVFEVPTVLLSHFLAGAYRV